MDTLKVTIINTIIILIAGTFNNIFPSLFIIGIDVEGQTAEPEYDYRKNNYNSEYYPRLYQSNDGYQSKDPHPDIVFQLIFLLYKMQ